MTAWINLKSSRRPKRGVARRLASAMSGLGPDWSDDRSGQSDDGIIAQGPRFQGPGGDARTARGTGRPAR
jgi:hypothetical protein